MTFLPLNYHNIWVFLIPVFFALFGLVIGSFLNVVIDRLPAGQSLVSPPSHCPACGRRLGPFDLIPVVSYLWLRGRCRDCGARIPARILWVELVTGLAFGLLTWLLGLTPELAVALWYFCLLLALAVIDLEQGLLLNAIIYPAIVLALVLSAALTISGYNLEIVPTLGRAAIGGGFGLVTFLLIAILSRGGMGWGDVKMAALLGVMLGFPMVMVGIFLGIISGGLVAVILMLARLKGRKQTVPFGPFLALGAFAALLWGQPMLDWYLRLFGIG